LNKHAACGRMLFLM